MNTARHFLQPSALPAARLATTVVFLLSGAGFATWATRIPAVKGNTGADHRTLGLAAGAVLSP